MNLMANTIYLSSIFYHVSCIIYLLFRTYIILSLFFFGIKLTMKIASSQMIIYGRALPYPLFTFSNVFQRVFPQLSDFACLISQISSRVILSKSSFSYRHCSLSLYPDHSLLVVYCNYTCIFVMLLYLSPTQLAVPLGEGLCLIHPSLFRLCRVQCLSCTARTQQIDVCH